jgi:hypothetical protein
MNVAIVEGIDVFVINNGFDEQTNSDVIQAHQVENARSIHEMAMTVNQLTKRVL